MTIHSEIITDEVPADGRYYAQGEHVRRAPIATKYEGGTRYDIGFTVCRMSAYVPDQAEIVASALNAQRHTLHAVKLLQRKAAAHFMMQAHYRECIREAKANDDLGPSMVRYYSEKSADEQRESAEASLLSRKLMGVA